MTSTCLSEVDNPDNEMALTARDLSTSNILSDNGRLRKMLQKNIACLKTKSNDLIVVQLRAQKVKSRIINQDVAMAMLPIEDQDTFDKYCHAKTLSSKVVSPIATNTNSRWYRNDLEKEAKIVNDSNFSTISSSSIAKIKSVISNDDDHVNVVSYLRRKVMKRLIDILSPTSNTKQIFFCNLISNNENIRTVIEIVIKMESSVDDKKLMLMSNCS